MLLKFVPGRSFLHRLKEFLKDSAIDTDKLTEKERRRICSHAIKAISEKYYVNFTNETVGPSQYYAIKVADRSTSDDNNWDIVRAFQCPTRPLIYLHIIDRESVEKTISIIIEGDENFEQLRLGFQK